MVVGATDLNMDILEQTGGSSPPVVVMVCLQLGDAMFVKSQRCATGSATGDTGTAHG
jgi:hypothetical protein